MREPNIFQRKIGPLPMWAWVAIVAAFLFAWRLYSSRQAASQQAAAQQASTANASQVPQFVNQTYTTVQPPTAPNMPTPAPPPHPRGERGPGPRPPTPPAQPAWPAGAGNSINVPIVTGINYAAAYNYLVQRGLQSGTPQNAFPAGATVTGQSVQGGTWVHPGTTVTLSVG